MPPGCQPGGIFLEPFLPIASPLRLSLLGPLLGLNLAAQAAPEAPAVSFDTTPRAGQHQRQTIDLQATMKMRLEAGPEATEEQRAKIGLAAANIEQMGGMKMAMQMQQTMKVDPPDADGWLPLTMSVANQGGKVEVGGKAMPMPTNKVGDMSFSARFNPKDFAFEVQKFNGGPAEMTEVMRNQGLAIIGEALQLYKALSQKPLKVGESVDVPLTMALPMPIPGGAGAMQGTVRYTLARVDKGVAHFDLAMDMKMDASAPLPAKPGSAPEAAEASPQMMKVAVTGSGKGTSSLRLSDRLPLSNRLAMAMKMTMNGPDNGRMFMDMDMTMQAKGESLARPAAAKKKS